MRFFRLVILASLIMLSAASFGQIKITDSLRWNIGTSFYTTSGFGSGLITWVSPSVRYKVGKNLSLFGGVSVINTTLFGAKPYFLHEGYLKGWSGNMTDLFIYGGGTYTPAPGWRITGSLWKQIPLLSEPLPGSSLQGYPSRSGHGMDVYMDYRIGRTLTIGAGFRYSQGANPFAPDPFGSDPFRSGGFFSPHPFGR